jgi:hypothetical protein
VWRRRIHGAEGIVGVREVCVPVPLLVERVAATLEIGLAAHLRLTLSIHSP